MTIKKIIQPLLFYYSVIFCRNSWPKYSIFTLNSNFNRILCSDFLIVLFYFFFIIFRLQLHKKIILFALCAWHCFLILHRVSFYMNYIRFIPAWFSFFNWGFQRSVCTVSLYSYSNLMLENEFHLCAIKKIKTSHNSTFY